MIQLDQIEEGNLYIAHCLRNTILSKVIGSISKGKSHNAFLFKVDGRLFVFDAQSYGCFVSTFDNWKERFGYRMEITQVAQVGPQENVSLELAIEVMQELFGMKYGFGDLFRHLIYRYTTIWISTQDEGNGIVCSELVMTVMHFLGIYPGEDYYKMNPQEVFEWALKNQPNE